MQVFKKRRIISLLLSIMMIFSILPITSFAVEDNSATIQFTVFDGSADAPYFKVINKQLKVAEGTAAKYGLQNAEPGHLVGGVDHGISEGQISVLDALVAAHEAVYGESFTSYSLADYMKKNSSYVDKIFEKSGSIGFALNGKLPVGTMSDGYAINEQPIKDNDILEFYFYGDSMWGDYLSYFDKSEAAVTTDEEFSLTLNGYQAMELMWAAPGTPTPELKTLQPISKANIAVVDAQTGKFDFSNGLCTDADGNVTLSFPATGTYLVSAYGMVNDVPIVSPLCTVTVTASIAKPIPIPTIEDYSGGSDFTYYQNGVANKFEVWAYTGNFDETGISYQWQQSTDEGENKTYADIEGATGYEYTPSTKNIGKTYYRVKAIQTLDGKVSEPAYVEYSVTVNEDNRAGITVKPSSMDDTNAQYSQELPYRIVSNNASTAVNLEDWNKDKYDFSGWSINKSEASFDKKIDSTNPQWLEYISVEAGNQYSNWSLTAKNTNFAIALSHSTILKSIDIEPVFTQKAEMKYTPSLVQTQGGSISRERQDGETHKLTATADALYDFERWESSTDNGATWQPVENAEATTQVTLTKNTSYRAIFSQIKVTLGRSTYALTSNSSDPWYLNVSASYSKAMTAQQTVTVKVYEGTTAEGKLLGTYETYAYNGNSNTDIKAKIDTRPTSAESSIFATVQVGTLETVSTTIKLCGTMDISPSSLTIDTIKNVFLENTNTFNLSATANPAAENLTWSGGSYTWKDTENSCKIDQNGIVTYTRYYSNNTAVFTADSGDGRVANAVVSFNIGNPAIKLNETGIRVNVGKSAEYDSVHSTAAGTLTVSRNKISVSSSDDSIFTAEIITKSTTWPKADDVVDKIKINGIKAGKGTLTIKSDNNEWKCPVVITGNEIIAESVALSQKTATIQTGNTLALTAGTTPETAAVVYQWVSSSPAAASVDKSGVVTGKAKGTATITVTAKSADKSIVTDTCDITVLDDPYTVKVYVPKNVVGENGLFFYPTTGYDNNNRDTFDGKASITDYTLDTNNTDYDIYTLALHGGTYSFRAIDENGKSLGGGAFIVPAEANSSSMNDGGGYQGREECTIYLREAKCWITNEYDGVKALAKDYNVTLQNKVGAVTMGEAFTDTDGYVKYPALLYVNGNALLYYSTLSPTSEYVSAHQVASLIKKENAVSTGTTAVEFYGALPAATAITINAPKGAEVSMYNQILNFNTTRINSDSQTELGDGTVEHIFYISRNSNMSYRVSMDGKRTKAGYSDAAGGSRLVVTLDDASPKEQSTDISAMKESSLIMNIGERNKLEMTEGQIFKLRSYRGSWQIINTITANIMIEPDFSYNILSGNDVISIDGVDGGNAGDNWAFITAKKEGVAIVEVTYDAIDINGTSNTGNGFYGASDPLRTGVFVVTVGKDSGDIGGIDWDSEYNTCYFFGDTGILSIEPMGKNVSVSVASVLNGKLCDFKNVTGAEGVFDVPVSSGNNIVKITADGVTDYRIVRGAKLTANIESPHEDGKVYPGDEITVSFEGLYQPAPKFSGIYNPGYGNTMKINFQLGEDRFASSGTQYNLIEKSANKFTVKVPDDAEGKITLTNGKITGTVMGDSYGKHRQLTDVGVPANFNASSLKLQDIAIADLEIPVIRIATDEAKTLAKEVITTAFAKYKQDDYTSSNWTKLVEEKDKGLSAIDKASELSEITTAKNASLLAMANIPQKSTGGTGGGTTASGIDKTHTKSYYKTTGLTFDLGGQKAAGYVTVSFEDYGKRLNDADFKTPLGVIISSTEVPYVKGDSIADVSVRLLKALNIKYGNTGSLDNSFYLSCIKDFCLSDGYKVSSFGEFDSGSGSGWMVTLNNWFVNRSTAEFTVEDGDLIKWQNTCQLGADIGCDWNNPSAKISGLKFKKNYGTLSPTFSKNVKEYTYTVPTSVKSICFEGTQENYWAILTYTSNGIKYKPMQEIPVEDGTVIKLDCAFSEYAGDKPSDTDSITITIKTQGNGPGTTSGGKPTTKPETDKPTVTEQEEKKDNTFGDISPSDWYYEAANYAYNNGLMNGTSATEFSPNISLTRGMLVTILGRLNGADIKDKISTFSDVGSTQYYSPYIAWAAENGIVSGIGDNQFAPDENITREQMAVIFTNYLKFIGKGPTGEWMINFDYKDKSQISQWAFEGVAFATIKGLFTGKDEGKFDPQGTATRAEVATILMRFCENLLNK